MISNLIEIDREQLSGACAQREGLSLPQAMRMTANARIEPERKGERGFWGCRRGSQKRGGLLLPTGRRDCRQGGERDTKRESSRPPATEVSQREEREKKGGGGEIPPANFDRSMLNCCIDQSNSAVSC